MSGPEGRLSGDEARSRLYDVMRADGTMEERIRAALEVGTEYFGVEHGYVAKTDEETDDWEVFISLDPTGDVHEGLNVDFSTTYCRRTIEEDGVVSFPDGPDEQLEADPEFQTYGFYCYHGAPVLVDSETFGTVCFASTDARAEAFSDAEKAFTDLLAEMVGHEIEREQRKAQLDEREAQLEERREIYRAVIDSTFDLLFRFDTEGTYVYHSPASEPLLGYEPEEIVGQQYTFLLPDEETERLAGELFESVLAGETVEETYLPLQTADRDIVYVDVRVTPIYQADVPVQERTPEDIVAIQGTARDATQRKQRERLNRVLNRVLRHNLRNDMTIVEGYAEVLEDRLEGENVDLVERIKHTARHLVELGETARGLEENFQNPPTVEAVDVVPTVQQAVTRVEEHYDGATVTVDAPERALAKSAPRLETALWELVDNAAKHAGTDPTVDVSVTVSEDAVAIHVVDDGPGIPKDEAAVLTSGEETSLVHGSGLGLWLVYWVVTSLDGHVEVPTDTDGGEVVLTLDRPDET